MSCALGSASLSITNDEIRCGTTLITGNEATVTGSGGSENSIVVTDRRSNPVTIHLKNIALFSDSPFQIINSIVTLNTIGSSAITPTNETQAISCSGNSEITLTGSDSLTVGATTGHPGIGAPPGGTCDKLRFESGTYILAGATSAASIGAGRATSGEATRVGAIEITGGTFMITQANYGTGIGAGYATATSTSGVTSISITGGDLTISAKEGSAIGAGAAIGGRSEVDTITISNTIINTQSADGSGIGSGYATESGASVVNSIQINSGTFNFTGVPSGKGAIVGSGYVWNGTSAVNTIGIVDGKFTVRSNHAIAIGAGDSVHYGTSRVGTITIRSGEFDIISQHGIGAGDGVGGNSTVDRLEIIDGQFNVTASDGSAIGTADAGYGSSRVGTLIIRDGRYNLTSLKGAAIGTGVGVGPSVDIAAGYSVIS
jgi:hypothetical protein